MRLFICLAALAGATVAAAFSVGPASSVSACGRAGYSYAGLAASGPARGVRAVVVPLGNPYVESGHVAAWVGVGGPGLGAGGTDAWIQVGLSAFQGTESKLYFEINKPGVGPQYTQVLDRIAPGSRHRIAVAEVHRRPGWWRVWVNGTPVSQPVYLPGSHARWRPIATAETWDGGRRVCNLFAYRFDRLTVTDNRGSAWSRFRSGGRFQDPGYRVLSRRNGFVARAVRPLPRGATSVVSSETAPASDASAPADDQAVTDSPAPADTGPAGESQP